MESSVPLVGTNLGICSLDLAVWYGSVEIFTAAESDMKSSMNEDRQANAIKIKADFFISTAYAVAIYGVGCPAGIFD